MLAIKLGTSAQTNKDMSAIYEFVSSEIHLSGIDQLN